METPKVLQIIDQLIARLRNTGAGGIEQYERKLKNNVKDIGTLYDLLFEGQAALLFLNNGFKVTLGDSPDLKMELDGEGLYAEVKHIREKEQDQIDEKAMAEQDRKAEENEEEDILVSIGNAKITDKKTNKEWAIWEVIANVAISKAEADQYVANAPNILIIESSSESTSLTLSSAALEYDDRICESQDLRFRRLNALMMVNCGLYAFGDCGTYNTEYCQLAHADVSMSNNLISVLSNMNLG